MANRLVRLLVVEDDEIQRRLLTHHLKKVSECEFAITAAVSEAEAISAFDAQPSDLVLLDYQLQGGDGLSCLKSLRQRNALVPIIAVSGVASQKTAADLLRHGADDFLHKQDMTSVDLSRSIGMALARADARRRRAASSPNFLQARARVQLLLQALQDPALAPLLQHAEALQQMLGGESLRDDEWTELLQLTSGKNRHVPADARLLMRTILLGLRRPTAAMN